LVVGLGLGIVLGVVAIVVIARQKPASDASEQAIPMPSSSVHAAVAASSAPSNDPVALVTPSSSASAVAAPAQNRVRIVPALARVLVDGKPVDKDAEGYVVIDGAPNSSHTVAVHWGSTPTIKQVVLTDKGPVPSEVVAPLEAGTSQGAQVPPSPGSPPAGPLPTSAPKAAPAPKKIEF
jgi:hypothetical protein